MPVTFAMPPPQPPLAVISKPLQKSWTRDECVALENAGIVDPEAYELIEGDLILKMGKKFPHSLVVTLLTAWLSETFGGRRVAPEPGIDVSPEDNPTSQPEPDVVLLRKSIRELGGAIRAADIQMLAEVSSSSLQFDLVVKSQLYARAQIPEYWVLDVESERVIVHREPSDGAYKSVVAYSRDEEVSTLASAEHSIKVGDLMS